ncbi:MAG: NADH:ubiquinone reductase (Na(+)-transporting) subunit C [Bacteroidetes bacterium]|nr:MAG: NADH:ubiquinone reductase (Na(+)-transporting) subunit C [Bacteroidota bacterium]TAG85933.1 MAG: NADH:ubiquinone reductase (Na(+)-transporting) subunit C [Bacteroidota bacterium]
MSQPNEKPNFRQSNVYVVMYSVILTVLCGLLLAIAALGLKPAQDANIEMEKKQNILSAAGIKTATREEAAKLYEEKVSAYAVDFKGQKLDKVSVGSLDLVAEWKKKPEERKLPVYEISNKKGEKADFFVVPVYGFGLWNEIWGYVALKGDVTTINGVKFDHKGETPGLGARIATSEIQDRYVGKKIFKDSKLTPTFMEKGEQGGGSRSIEAFKTIENKVDGMSGATITGVGLSAMLEDYLKCYESFFKSKLANNKVALN